MNPEFDPFQNQGLQGSTSGGKLSGNYYSMGCRRKNRRIFFFASNIHTSQVRQTINYLKFSPMVKKKKKKLVQHF